MKNYPLNQLALKKVTLHFSKHLFLFGISCGIIFLNSCKKEITTEVTKPIDSLLVQKIESWLNAKLNTDTSSIRKGKIQMLLENLSFENLWQENLNSEEKFIAVPIKESFISNNNASKHPQNYLLLILDSNTKIRKGNIVQIIGKIPNANKLIMTNTFSSIFNKKSLPYDAQFYFLSITDELNWGISFKDSEINSFSYVGKKAGARISGKVNDCVSWYLVTTYYSNGVEYDQTWEYLGTWCDDICNSTRTTKNLSFRIECGGGAPADEQVQIFSKAVNFTVGSSSIYSFYVKSYETLNASKSGTSMAIFTSIMHSTSSIFNAGSQFYSSWQQLNAVPTLLNDYMAKATISGKVTPYVSGSTIPLMDLSLTNDYTWFANVEFP